MRNYECGIMNAKSGSAVLFHEVMVTDSRIYDVADIVYLGVG